MIAKIVDTLGTVPKVWKKDWDKWKSRGRIVTIQTTASLRLSRILGRILGDLRRLSVRFK